jgi:hypothetical protein
MMKPLPPAYTPGLKPKRILTDKKPDDLAKDLIAEGHKMFSKKVNINALWQIIADQFYPERACFTRDEIDGEEYGRHLSESTPVQMRRELGNAVGIMTRPAKSRWFMPRPAEEFRTTDGAKQWLDEKGDAVRHYLYAPRSNFNRAWNEADHDVVTFGNAVIGFTTNDTRDGFHFECFHLRDCAWTHNHYRVVDTIYRKFKMSLRQIVQKFGAEVLSKEQKDIYDNDPHCEIEIWSVCKPLKDYEPLKSSLKRPQMKGRKVGANRAFEFVCVYIDPSQHRILDECGYYEFPYIVRRWHLNGHSPYAISPVTATALADARLLQVQASTILEAGELAVRPPIIATEGAIIGGEIGDYSGAVTWVSADYDEKLGAALRPMDTGANMRLGLDFKKDSREILAAAMYVNKLALPGTKDMTAFEVGERIEEYARSLRAVLEPFQADHAIMLDLVWTALIRITMDLEAAGWMGPFSPLAETPQELTGGEVTFEFDGPLEAAIKKQEASKAMETARAAGEVAAVFPETLDNYDADALSRDAAAGIGGRARWLKPAKAVAATRDARAKQQQAAEAAKAQQAKMDMMAKAGQAAGNASRLIPAMAQARQMGGIGAMGGPGNGAPQDDMSDLHALLQQGGNDQLPAEPRSPLDLLS